MIESKQYKYIGLDFETTGLDITKDEPIQIGIATLDENGNIKEKFQTLIKPNKKTDELKHIVGFITGLSIADLETAPTRAEVLPQIQKFFDEDTIVIGHNIKFDLDFIDKYFPECKYAGSIDTYPLSQTFVHYAPSYALEVLVAHVQTKEPAFNDILMKMTGAQHNAELAHDALYDTLESLAMYRFFVERTNELGKKYGSLLTIRDQSSGFFPQAITAKTSTVSTKIQFPSLQRIAPQNISLAEKSNLSELENHKRYYVGDMDIKVLLKEIASQKNVILVFQNIQKLDIAKMILAEMGVKNIGFIKEDQTINEEMFADFLNKGQFTETEFLFVCKYLSHLDKGYGTLDLNNGGDRKIYYAIKDTRVKVKYPLILATHSGIYSMMKEENHFPDYDIYFFDTERRYKTYNFFLSRPADLYYTLNLIESLLYREQVALEIKKSKQGKTSLIKEGDHEVVEDLLAADKALQDFHSFFQILIGILSTETKKIFTNTDLIYIPHDPIVDHSDFHQTNQMRKQLPEHMGKVKAAIGEELFAPVEKQIQQLDHIFNNVVNISKKMYSQSDFYFVYAEAQRYTNREEFLEIFTNNVYFLSNNNKEHIPLLDKGGVRGGFDGAQPIKTKIPTRNLGRVDQITKHIQGADVKTLPTGRQVQNIFIFSPKKEESKKIFEDLCQKGIQEQALILVENITGGVGKNVFKASGTGRKIIIGGNSFLLYLYANGTTIDEVILFNSKGGSEQSILQDIQWYYPK
ncbi:MAG: 3'-5' exonuclease [candidate division SR1 bacterium]|nr:3'-5' exonuclease [candidate division SR1 bacterium]